MELGDLGHGINLDLDLCRVLGHGIGLFHGHHIGLGHGVGLSISSSCYV